MSNWEIQKIKHINQIDNNGRVPDLFHLFSYAEINIIVLEETVD